MPACYRTCRSSRRHALGVIAFLSSHDWRWLVGAALVAANWPYTLLIINRTNEQLEATPVGAASGSTRALIERWARDGCSSGLSLGVRLIGSGAGLRTAPFLEARNRTISGVMFHRLHIEKDVGHLSTAAAEHESAVAVAYVLLPIIPTRPSPGPASPARAG